MSAVTGGYVPDFFLGREQNLLESISGWEIISKCYKISGMLNNKI